MIWGGLLIYIADDFPGWGDPQAPASVNLSPYYIEQSIPDTDVPNVVTSILADYRGFDTMFETAVIFTAGLACLFLLRSYSTKEPDVYLYRHTATGVILRIEKGGTIPVGSADFERIDATWVPHDLIIKTTCRLILPFVFIFALYVIAHGHHSPGGGFQGGVILGAATIIFAISYNLRTATRNITERFAAFFSAAGVLLYASTGVLCMFFGGNFLDYGALAPLFGTTIAGARSLGILIVEIGVGMSVMAVMSSIYYNISSNGRLNEGL